MSRCLIIAEAGVNHNGDVRMAERLVRAAKRAGADAVKFQTFRAEKVAAAAAKKVGYQKKTVGEGGQVDMLRRLQMNESMHRKIMDVCRDERIQFLSTAFDYESVDLLACLKVPVFKIPSGEITNLPLLRYIAGRRKPVILSTGMASLEEVRIAVKVLRSSGVRALTLLHCVTEYPAPFDQVNLRAMVTLGKVFKVPYGFSDHTPGVWIPIAAAALGASVIEKHLTLDRNLPGPDHKASLEPDEFAELVSGVRSVEVALGDGVKRPALCEKKYIGAIRRSLVAAHAIARGARIAAKDVCVKRPGTGIPPSEISQVVGCRARRAIYQDEVLSWGVLL